MERSHPQRIRACEEAFAGLQFPVNEKIRHRQLKINRGRRDETFGGIAATSHTRTILVKKLDVVHPLANLGGRGANRARHIKQAKHL